MYPLTSLLERKIWTFLNSRVDILAIADVKDSHPKVNTDLLQGKGRVVINSSGNQGITLFLTDKISKPLFRFTCYSPTRSTCRQLQELLISAFENWSKTDFVMSEQDLQLTTLEGLTEPTFETSVNLYYASVLYQFHLSKY